MLEGRVIEVHRTNFVVKVAGQVYTATVRGSFHDEGDFPKVGDYVTLSPLDDEKAVIETVLPRQSVVKRKSPDGDEEQIIVANVDIIFVVMGLDGDFNPSRLERYLLLAQQSNVFVVVLLNKVDIVADVAQYESIVKEITGSTPVHSISATTGLGMTGVQAYFTPDTTAVLLGSSGAGKSTIANWLLQSAVQPVQATRVVDSRGRHTTTSRQLFALPLGGYLIDTPGMRELGMLESDADDESIVFERIEEIAARCKFRNCDHEKSAGCAVLQALIDGVLTERELQNYQKIIREREFHEQKDLTNSARHFAQNQKREQQKNTAALRRRLSRGG